MCLPFMGIYIRVCPIAIVVVILHIHSQFHFGNRKLACSSAERKVEMVVECCQCIALRHLGEVRALLPLGLPL